jgi:hypothetical protein
MLGAARTAWDSAVWSTQRRTTAAATNSTITFDNVNGAGVSTAKSQFGVASLNATSPNSMVSWFVGDPPVERLDLWPHSENTDFCIEGWLWIPSGRSSTDTAVVCVNNESTSATPTPPPITTGGGLGIRLGYEAGTTGMNYLGIFPRGRAACEYAEYTWPRNRWVHFAAQRKYKYPGTGDYTGIISFWADGRRLQTLPSPTGTTALGFNFPSVGVPISGSDTGISIANSALFYPLNPPNTAGTEPLLGWVDELCASSGWRYDDQYTSYVVPTAPFTVDTITNLLMHFDSNPAVSSAT